MNISKFLAKVLGIYFIIVSIAMFVNMHQFTIHVNQLIHDTPAMLISGFFTLILGLLMVVGHNIWKCSWRVLVTIIAWLSLLKGVSILFYPQYIDGMSMLFIQSPHFAYGAAGVDFILGVVLIYFGFKR